MYEDADIGQTNDVIFPNNQFLNGDGEGINHCSEPYTFDGDSWVRCSGNFTKSNSGDYTEG